MQWGFLSLTSIDSEMGDLFNSNQSREAVTELDCAFNQDHGELKCNCHWLQ